MLIKSLGQKGGGQKVEETDTMARFATPQRVRHPRASAAVITPDSHGKLHLIWQQKTYTSREAI